MTTEKPIEKYSSQEQEITEPSSFSQEPASSSSPETPMIPDKSAASSNQDLLTSSGQQPSRKDYRLLLLIGSAVIFLLGMLSGAIIGGILIAASFATFCLTFISLALDVKEEKEKGMSVWESVKITFDNILGNTLPRCQER